MSDLILELYVEEIPALMQRAAKIGYKEIFSKKFDEAGIKYELVNVNIGPRRIAIHISGINPVIAAQSIELRGPRVGAPDQAIEGFCKAQNIGRSELRVESVKGQEYYFYKSSTDERKLIDLLPEILPSAISEYIWPKSMYWGKSEIKFVRPLKNIMCLLDGTVVDFTYHNLTANNKTYGHRFIRYNELEIENFEDYKNKLQENFVILSREERKKIILEQIGKIASLKSLSINDESLVEEIAGLVEYPNAMIGQIPEKFMVVPTEILVTAMRNHQRYFALNNKEGSFAPYFIFVSNLPNSGADVVSGNEKVLSARLSDSLFFYKSDQQRTLESRTTDLKKMIFHAKLGSIYDKVERITSICKFLDNHNHDLHKAAMLCKSDLTTEVVGEFPELQGIMGGYYAKIDGHSNEICESIRNHYKPEGIDDAPPSGIAAILALTDKIDSLVSLYIAGERSTGSKDPYALRRYALGIIRIILNSNIRVNILQLISYASSIITAVEPKETDVGEILSFIEDRLKAYMKNDFDHNVIAATIDLESETDIYMAYQKAIALRNFISSKNGEAMIAAYRRAANIAGEVKHISNLDKSYLLEESEILLFEKLEEMQSKIDEMIKHKDFESAMNLLSTMLEPINRFFDNVTVISSDEKLTNNRLSLLSGIVTEFHKIANFSKL